MSGSAERIDKPGLTLEQASESLLRGELQHRQLFERNPLPMWIYDLETLRILAVSDSAVVGYGYSRAEFLALTLRDITPDGDLEWLDSVTSVRGPRPGRTTYHTRHLRKDGSIIEVESSGDDIDLGGKRCRIVLSADVTSRNRAIAELFEAREQLVASAEEHRLLFESNPQPLIVYDCETLKIVAASGAATIALGYTLAEYLEMTLVDIAPVDEHAAMVEFARSNAAGTPAGLQFAHARRQRRKDGVIIDVEVTSDDLIFRGRACRAFVSVDVTERNRINAELAIARDKAVEASNLKSAFLANMSHEIRTPMNGVIGMTELLLEMDLTAEQRECAGYIASSGEQMLSIINDILDISKIETGKLELDLDDFDLHAAIEATCAAARMQANAKGLELFVAVADAVPSRVHGDKRRLHQVVLNLVANAVKFTAEGSITVRAAVAPHGGSVVRFEVVDTGIGIDVDKLHDMFEPFTQADASTTRNYGGTGLGLAIARELVELMGGTIGAESEIGAGSTFWFELPVGAATLDVSLTGGDSLGAMAPVWSTRPHVLVAEDTPINQIVARRALERCGCDVEVVEDGLAALRALESRRYDLVLMDCQMPQMDGYAATRALRRREVDGTRRTCVIAMTAQALDGDRDRCLEAGMDDFISKPMRYADLTATLKRWIPVKGG